MTRPTTGLAKLSIAYDVDPNVCLLTHDLGNRSAERRRELCIITCFAVLACADEREQFWRPKSRCRRGWRGCGCRWTLYFSLATYTDMPILVCSTFQRWPSTPAGR
jgi:hypothetical protein